jgi:hypothetical protein
MKRLAVILGMFTLLLVSSSNAQQRWERNYGGAGDDYGAFVQQTQDTGYIVVGLTTSFGNGMQIYLIKTNALGDTLWTRNYGGTGDDEGVSVRQTQDGGYIVAGGYNYSGGAQVCLIKTNALGDTLWTRTYGGAGNDWGEVVQQTQDGGYILVGFTTSFGSGEQVYLIKTNAGGDTLWTRTYGETGDDEGWFVQQTQDTGYIVAGIYDNLGTNPQVYLIKTNAGGDTLWTRTYGWSGQNYGGAVQQTSDGGYIVAGYTNSFGKGDQVYLIKTNASGDTLWTRNYGGTGNDRGCSVQQTQDGGYIVAGAFDFFGANPQVYLIKTNAGGDTLWTRNYGGTGEEVCISAQQTQDTGYILVGWTRSFGNGYQVYLVKTDANGSSGIENERGRGFEGPRVQGLKATPNPFTTFATVPGHEAERFSLYDVSGKRVGTYRGDRVGEGLAAGVYFLRSSESKDKPLRIVKVR